MKDEDFQRIRAGLEDAIAFVKGDTTKGRVAAGPKLGDPCQDQAQRRRRRR